MDAIKNAMSGNTFNDKSWSVGGGSHVWREIRHRFPAGASVQNLASYKTASGSIIPAGTPVTFIPTDYSGKEAVVYTTMPTAWAGSKKYAKDALVTKGNKIYKAKAEIAASVADWSDASWEEQTIDGFTQDDVVVDSDTNVATVTVVYAGELYAYMYDSATLNVIKANKPAEIQLVY